MKKILALLAVLTAVWCASCSHEDDNDPLKEGEEGVITMIVDVKYDKGGINPNYMTFCIHSFKEGEIITVDWGDDWVEEFKTVVTDESKFGSGYGYCTDELEHSYAKHKSYTITIKGNIKGLEYDSKEYSAHLISLDASRCPALKYLDCSGNKLTSLDVSKNAVLEYLDCSGNELTSLDVSKNTMLKYLDCSDIELTSLNVSKNTVLEELDCHDNWLTSLDISKNTVLEKLDLYNNNFSASTLNKIFTDLPQRSINSKGYIYIGYNPGTETCDTSIAYKKDWHVQ